jgi:FHS family L-fucose permease-like MFS transporter
MIGRFVGTATLRKFDPSQVLAAHAISAALLVVATMVLSGHAAMWAVLCVGLFNSVMFPAIFTFGIDSLGEQTGRGSGLLCTAIVGGAIVPVIQGKVADKIGVHHSFVIPVACYVYIGWYAMWARTRLPSRKAHARR